MPPQQSTQSSKDPSQYTQCWCHKCRGGTVTKRTERNHRESPRAANAPEPVLHNQRKLRNPESRTPVENNMNHVPEGHHITRIYERNEAAVDRSTKKRRLDEQQPNEIDSDPLDEYFTPDGPSGIEFDVEVTQQQDPLSRAENTGDFDGNSNTDGPHADAASQSLVSSPSRTSIPTSMDHPSEDLQDDLPSDSERSKSDAEFDTEKELGLFNGEDEEASPYVESRIDHILLCQKYIQEISLATLDNGKLDASIVKQLRSPEEGPVDISDPDIRLSLDLFLGCSNASEATYNAARDAILRRFPGCDVLSHYRVKKLVAEISGVVSVLDDMCVNSCEAFVGPKADYEACSICLEPRYKVKKSKRVPQQQMITIPLGPQIQALRRSPKGATAMRYRDQKVKQIFGDQGCVSPQDYVYDDIFSGSELLDMSKRLEISAGDTTVSFSLDGAQLYQNKKSDTWIAIWIINDYDPAIRYKKKHILPALVVPGPNKPKDLDSFMFRSFHHLSAIQRENNGAGICTWDALSNATTLSRTFFILGTADAVGLTELDGRVGHHGAQGCRMSCNMKGRHKPNSGHYFAAHLRPNGTNADDCNHEDYNFRALPRIPSSDAYQVNISKVIASKSQAEYERNRKSTGLSKPSIISGLHVTRCISVPCCFTVDLMHLLTINLGELLVPLWRGELKCESTDDKASWDWVALTGNNWLDHGRLVAAATTHFPSSFHRPPRNPAEKISSGYKATEYYLYLFGLGPALFRVLLPEKYWMHFCKLV
ncbi:hypothetical protein M378DRAFT_127762, partial [Amanita muscaria Koide BX008]